jgi:uncharacterized integral membrane protein (TIGR00697 family)
MRAIMESYKHETYITNPKCLNFISMVYICILFVSAVIGSKLVITPIGIVSAGSLTGPFWFILSDIIAEVYGYQYSKQIFISAMICELLFIFISIFLIHLPSPSYWHWQFALNFAFDNLPMIYLCQLIAIIIAWNINIRCLLRWKVLLRGKYFWLRSIGSSSISEIIFSIISVGLNMFARKHLLGFNNETLFKIVLGSIILKILFSIIFAYPAQMTVKILKYIENIKTIDPNASVGDFFKDKKETN